MSIIPPENGPNTAQPKVGENEPEALQPAKVTAARQKESRRSSGKGQRSVRDYKYSDIKPMMLRNREKGQKPLGTAIHKCLRRKYRDHFAGQLRTTQRIVRELNRELDEEHKQRIKQPDQPFPEVFIPQDHHPGEVAQIDCSSLASLGITIGGMPFKGKIFTFKLMYSKWIHASIVSGETSRSSQPLSTRCGHSTARLDVCGQTMARHCSGRRRSQPRLTTSCAPTMGHRVQRSIRDTPTRMEGRRPATKP